MSNEDNHKWKLQLGAVSIYRPQLKFMNMRNKFYMQRTGRLNWDLRVLIFWSSFSVTSVRVIDINSRPKTFLLVRWELFILYFHCFNWTIVSIFRYQIPDNWPYEEARQLFKEPEVCADDNELEIKWTAPDDEVTDTWYFFCACAYVCVVCEYVFFSDLFVCHTVVPVCIMHLYTHVDSAF